MHVEVGCLVLAGARKDVCVALCEVWGVRCEV